MTREEAIKFASHAQSLTDLPEVKEFYALAESALREQEERRWIPATERLPRNYTPVLACIPSLAQTKQQTVHECHIGADGEWHSATAPAYREAVTHWMPLPKPPKEV